MPAPRTRMIDVGDKPVTLRRAKAAAFVALRPETIRTIRQDRIPKGDLVGTATLAGIMAAKRTAEIVPLCHPVPLSHVDVTLELKRAGVKIVASAAARARTGVEMEALVAASAAALTVYDMCKSLDRSAVIREILLLEKSGGRSGEFVRGRSRRNARSDENSR